MNWKFCNTAAIHSSVRWSCITKLWLWAQLLAEQQVKLNYSKYNLLVNVIKFAKNLHATNSQEQCASIEGTYHSIMWHSSDKGGIYIYMTKSRIKESEMEESMENKYSYIKLFSCELRRLVWNMSLKSWRIVKRVIKDHGVIDSEQTQQHHTVTIKWQTTSQADGLKKYR